MTDRGGDRQGPAFEGRWLAAAEPLHHLAMDIRRDGDRYVIQPEHPAGTPHGEPLEARLEDGELVARDLHGDEAGMLSLALVAGGARLELAMPDAAAPIEYVREPEAGHRG